MQDLDFNYLNFNMIAFDDGNEDSYPQINFEKSKQGMWLSLENTGDFNLCIKEIIALAFNFGFLWNEGDGDVQLAQNLENLKKMNDEPELDSLFIEAFNYLNDEAFNDDPGWELIFDRSGLKMQSIWTEDSDIWDESREARPPSPTFSSEVIRKMLENNL